MLCIMLVQSATGTGMPCKVCTSITTGCISLTASHFVETTLILIKMSNVSSGWCTRVFENQ